MIKNTTIILLIGLMTSCSKSLVYSPSINLPNQPLKEKAIDIQGGIELLPETRPEELQGNQTTFGMNGQLSYGFTEKFTLSIKGWGDLEGRENVIRSGYSLSGQFLKSFDEKSNIIFLPRIGIALDANDIAGYGLGTSVIYQHIINEKLSWYGGAGLFWGFKDLDKELNLNNEEKSPMGFGVIGNLGIGWQLSNNIRLNCELSPIYQINAFDENTQLMFSPTFGIAYSIKLYRKI